MKRRPLVSAEVRGGQYDGARIIDTSKCAAVVLIREDTKGYDVEVIGAVGPELARVLLETALQMHADSQSRP